MEVQTEKKSKKRLKRLRKAVPTDSAPVDESSDKENHDQQVEDESAQTSVKKQVINSIGKLREVLSQIPGVQQETLTDHNLHLFCSALSLNISNGATLIGQSKAESNSKPKGESEDPKNSKASGFEENFAPNDRSQKKKRLEKLAKKVADNGREKEMEALEERRKTKKMLDNYALGNDDDEDYQDEPNPKDVADELENDSLYCADDASEYGSSDSGSEKGKKGKGRKRRDAKKKVGVIRVNNKFYDNMYDEDNSDNNCELPEVELKELSFDANEGEPSCKELKFDSVLKNKLNESDKVIISDLWRKVSKNQLAEKGIELKLNVTQILKKKTEVEVVNTVEKAKFSALELPTFEMGDHEIEFVDPDRLKKEIKEKEEREKDPEERKAPVTILNTKTLNKRSMFLQSLRAQNMSSVDYSSIHLFDKVSTLVSAPKAAEETAVADPAQAETNLAEVEEYMNEDAEGEGEEVICNKKIRELEGDVDEEDADEDEELDADEAEGEGDQDEAEGEGDNDEQQDQESEGKQNEEEKLDPQKQMEQLKKLRMKIMQRRQASKFLEMEAELGSDNEENDGVMKQINKGETEEILDKKLEFLDADLEDLIDNSIANNVLDDTLAAKFLQDDIMQDKQNLIKLITTITSGNRRRKNVIGDEGLENEDDNVILARMRQRQNEIAARDQELYNHEEVKQRIQQVCEDEDLDEAEKQRIIDEEIRRKVRQFATRIKKQMAATPAVHLNTENYDKLILEEDKDKNNRGKQVTGKTLLGKFGRKSVSAQLFKHPRYKC